MATAIDDILGANKTALREGPLSRQRTSGRRTRKTQSCGDRPDGGEFNGTHAWTKDPSVTVALKVWRRTRRQ
jgi:hypothetical protein